jgi:hypothetical protein
MFLAKEFLVRFAAVLGDIAGACAGACRIAIVVRLAISSDTP